MSKCETRVHNPHRNDIKRAETNPCAVEVCASSPVVLGDVLVSRVFERVRVDFYIQAKRLQRVIISDNIAEVMVYSSFDAGKVLF